MRTKVVLALLTAGVLVGTLTVWLYENRADASPEPPAATSETAHEDHDHSAQHADEDDSHGEETGHEGHNHKAGDKAPMDNDSHEGHSHGPAQSQGEAAHKDESGHEGHDHSEGGAHAEDIAILSEEQIKANNVKIVEAGPGDIAVQLALPGEVRLNSDRVAHVVPRVAGIVREVLVSVGEDVKAGQVMAVLESRELATLKAEYLAARERQSLAKATFDREKGLWEKKISAEQDFLSAKQTLAECAINVERAEQQLHAAGFSEDYLKGISGQTHVSYTRYEIIAPFDGSVIEKHITLGESLKDDVSAFTLADLNTVWVNLSVYQKDVSALRKGQPVTISEGDNPATGVNAKVDYVGPLVGEQTRTATARVTLPNENGQWRPGQFVTGFVSTEVTQAVPVVVPKAALQTFEESTVVFTQTDKGFVPARVTLGRSNDSHVEIAKGLEQGTRVVVEGAFVIKAEIAKAIMEGKTCSGH